MEVCRQNDKICDCKFKRNLYANSMQIRLKVAKKYYSTHIRDQNNALTRDIDSKKMFLPCDNGEGSLVEFIFCTSRESRIGKNLNVCIGIMNALSNSLFVCFSN